MATDRSPPSMYRRPATVTGGKTPGTAQLAATARPRWTPLSLSKTTGAPVSASTAVTARRARGHGCPSKVRRKPSHTSRPPAPVRPERGPADHRAPAAAVTADLGPEEPHRIEGAEPAQVAECSALPDVSERVVLRGADAQMGGDDGPGGGPDHEIGIADVDALLTQAGNDPGLPRDARRTAAGQNERAARMVLGDRWRPAGEPGRPPPRRRRHTRLRLGSGVDRVVVWLRRHVTCPSSRPPPGHRCRRTSGDERRT